MKTKQSYIPISSIKVPDRFRKDLGEKLSTRDSFEALLESIRVQGLIHPVAVVQEGETYSLLAGGRRLAACKKLEWTEIPAHIFPEATTEIERRTIELVENLNRKDLRWQEESDARAELDHLMKAQQGARRHGETSKAEGWATSDTAKVTGVDIRSVQMDIELSKAMTVFPEIKGAKTKNEALGKLRSIKAQTGMSLLNAATTPETEKLIEVIGKAFRRRDFLQSPEDQTKMKHRGTIILLTQTLVADSPDDISLHELVLETLSLNGFVITFNRDDARTFGNLGLDVGEALWVWNAVQDGSLQVLQKNYAHFWYCRRGSCGFSKAHSAVFQVKLVPRHLKTHEFERPIELYQEIISVFAHKSSMVVVPELLEGNALLGSLNAGIACAGYETKQEFYEAFEKKVKAFNPGSYTSYPANVKMEET